ncbi:MAG: hypothetical protein ABF289_15530 [Clostridiales bacterium]
MSEESYSKLFRRMDKKSYGLGYHIINLCKKKIIFNYGINKGWRTFFFIIPIINEATAIFANSDNSENTVKKYTLSWIEERIGSLTSRQIELLNLKECNFVKSNIKNLIYLFK